MFLQATVKQNRLLIIIACQCIVTFNLGSFAEVYGSWNGFGENLAEV